VWHARRPWRPREGFSAGTLVSHTARALARARAGLSAGSHERQPQEKPSRAIWTSRVGRKSICLEIDGRACTSRSRGSQGPAVPLGMGEILARVIDRIQELGGQRTDWNSRASSNQPAAKVTLVLPCDHGEHDVEMKFRRLPRTFQPPGSAGTIPLKTLQPARIAADLRQRATRQIAGPYEDLAEVEIRAHSLEEIDTPAFWEFVDEAVRGFFRFTERALWIWKSTSLEEAGTKMAFSPQRLPAR